MLPRHAVPCALRLVPDHASASVWAVCGALCAVLMCGVRLPQGELDDMKLVDGAAGERAIYRRRGKPEQQHGLVQRVPKRLVFCLDCSASMARGNSWDGRLDRMAQVRVSLRRSFRESAAFACPSSAAFACPSASTVGQHEHAARRTAA
jgi:hypothetical protein